MSFITRYLMTDDPEDEGQDLCEDGAEPQALLLDFSDAEWQAEIDRALDGWAEPRKAA